jgi:hypothetical protein
MNPLRLLLQKDWLYESFSFHELFQMPLLLRDGNHVQKGCICFDVGQLIQDIVLGRGERGVYSLTVRNLRNLNNNSG